MLLRSSPAVKQCVAQESFLYRSNVRTLKSAMCCHVLSLFLLKYLLPPIVPHFAERERERQRNREIESTILRAHKRVRACVQGFKDLKRLPFFNITAGDLEACLEAKWCRRGLYYQHGLSCFSCVCVCVRVAHASHLNGYPWFGIGLYEPPSSVIQPSSNNPYVSDTLHVFSEGNCLRIFVQGMCFF